MIKQGNIRHAGGRAGILMNRTESRPRQRLTVAVELAHWPLHPQMVRDRRGGTAHSVLYRPHPRPPRTPTLSP